MFYGFLNSLVNLLLLLPPSSACSPTLQQSNTVQSKQPQEKQEQQEPQHVRFTTRFYITLEGWTEQHEYCYSIPSCLLAAFTHTSANP
jgi:hypothetical protein